MTSTENKRLNPETLLLRKKAGTVLKHWRLAAGLTQRAMAFRVGERFYTFISQIENGAAKVPAASYSTWAEVLGVRPDFFARRLLEYYDPHSFRMLYESAQG